MSLFILPVYILQDKTFWIFQSILSVLVSPKINLKTFAVAKKFHCAAKCNQYLIICVHDKALNVIYVLISDGLSSPDEVDDFWKIVTVFSLFYFSKFIILRWPWNREKIIFSLFMYLKWCAYPFFISSLMTLMFVNSTSSFAGTTKNGSSCACSSGSTCLANNKWHD